MDTAFTRTAWSALPATPSHPAARRHRRRAAHVTRAAAEAGTSPGTRLFVARKYGIDVDVVRVRESTASRS